MVWVGLAIELGDMRRWLITPRVGGRPDCCLERQGGEVIQDGAPAPSLRGTGLCLSMAPGLDGVMNVTVVVDLVACGGTLRRKVAPSP